VDERDAAGPRFFCSDLVEGDCAQCCDWERAFAERHAFDALGKLSYERVFVKDASSDEQQVCCVDFLHWTRAGGREDEAAEGSVSAASDAAALPADDRDVDSDGSAKARAQAASGASACCSVVGCDNVPDKERSFTIFHGRARTPQIFSQLCTLGYMHLQKVPAKTGAAARLARLWTDTELRADARRRREVTRERGNALPSRSAAEVVAGHETLRLRDRGYGVLYLREPGEVAWSRATMTLRRRAAARASFWPERAVFCADAHVPPRACKNRTIYRERLVRRVHDAHRVLGNLVLFCCRVCRERFPTFHPAHAPQVDLTILASCPVAVAEWEGGAPADARASDAPLHRGVCRRCADELRAVEDDPELRGVARFSGANHMDPLMGYPDDVAARRELDSYIDGASVVESMLVALHHMQVSVCYLRGRHSRFSALSCFRKNIISFPQDLLELQQMHSFLSRLTTNDVVHIDTSGAGGSSSSVAKTVRARIVRASTRGFVVEDAAGVVRDVPRSAVRQVLRLPFTPRDLHDKFIVFRRKDSAGDDYVEDLRVRRNLVRGLLQLLSKKGFWRPDHGEEPVHKYYTNFEWLDEDELEALLPEDGVPEGLRYETLRDDDVAEGLGAEDFEEWLRWGR
jgi:hypothetical protein